MNISQLINNFFTNIGTILVSDLDSDLKTSYESINRGGWFVLNSTIGEVAVFHGLKSFLTLNRVAFFRRDIEEVREWLAQDQTRQVLCCYSAYLPSDLKERALVEYEAPIYIADRGRVLMNGSFYTTVELQIVEGEAITDEYVYGEDEEYIYGTGLNINVPSTPKNTTDHSSSKITVEDEDEDFDFNFKEDEEEDEIFEEDGDFAFQEDLDFGGIFDLDEEDISDFNEFDPIKF